MIPLFRKLRWLTERKRKEAELREELQFHLNEEAEQHPGEGIRAARRDLGNITLVQEETRAAWGWTAVEQLWQDLCYGCRMLKANKAFSALAILSLGLGIGANTAIYSFMDSILLRSLPVFEPRSLAVLKWHNKSRPRGTVVHSGSGTIYYEPKTGSTGGIFPYPVFELFQKSSGIFSRFPFRPPLEAG